MSALLAPFRRTVQYCKQKSHERPVIFYAVALGAVGPLSVLIVPPVRKSFGWKPPAPIPTTYPLPSQQRNSELKGYEDAA